MERASKLPPNPMELGAPVKMRVWKAETKISMSNERTFIAWLRTAATLAVGGLFSALGRETKSTVHWDNTMFGLIQLTAATTICVVSIGLYYQRRRLLVERFHGSWGSRWPPAIIGCLILLGLLADVSLMFRMALDPTLRRCALLPLPVEYNATPPFLYMTFHGTANPGRVSSCADGVAGVHRFTLRGGYAGLVSDQAAAQMHHPRAMAELQGLLFVAESWASDPSITVFGGCAGPGAMRPFLGRIRPKLLSTEIVQSFAHPYGVAAAPDGTLHVSSEMGAAVVGVDVATSAMRIVHQVDKPRPQFGAEAGHSGPLRANAFDAAGCEHVADHHGSVIWHYCAGPDGTSGPADVPAMSRVPKPIGLHVDGGRARLFVTSLGDATLEVPPAIYVLDLAAANPDGSHPVASVLTDASLVHPTGLLLYHRTLYVLEQSTSSLVKPSTRERPERRPAGAQATC